MTSPLLLVREVHKRFGGAHALRGVSLDVRPGEVHALVGENGAGKSTLINILAGAMRRDGGSLRFCDTPIDFASPAHSQAVGIAVIHQELATLPTMSIAENVFMGRMPSRGGWIDRVSMYERTARLLDEVGLALDPRTRVGTLGLSQQQLVEIAKALAAGARLLIMDEPTASLTDHEARRLLALVRRLRATGVSVLYVSHRLAEVFEVADRITVLRDGRTVQTADAIRTTMHAVVDLMVGRALESSAHDQPREPGDTVLDVRGLTRRGVLQDVSFSIRAGEVVGFAGLVGAGRTEVARAMFGADPIDSGTITLRGKVMRMRSPADAMVHGIAMVPEDRKQQALFMDKPVRWNISMARLPFLRRGVVVSGRDERALVNEYVHRLHIRAPDINEPVRNLSGGNQQKAVLARWLATKPSLLILDEPTHGVDIGAKAEVYALVRELARQGVAILLISSDLPEILDWSHRVVGMRGGRVVATLDRADATEARVMRCATGTDGG